MTNSKKKERRMEKTKRQTQRSSTTNSKRKERRMEKAKPTISRQKES